MHSDTDSDIASSTFAKDLIRQSFKVSDSGEKLRLLEQADAVYSALATDSPPSPEDAGTWRCWGRSLLLRASLTGEADKRVDLIRQGNEKYAIAASLATQPAEVHFNWGISLGALALELSDPQEVSALWELAEAKLRIALEVDPEHGRASHLLADCLLEKSKTAAEPEGYTALLLEAEQHAATSCRLTPESHRSWNLWGLGLRRRAKFAASPDEKQILLQEAVAKFETAIAAGPGDAEFHSNLGVTLEALAKLPATPTYESRALVSRAVVCHEAALARDGENSNYYMNSGKALLLLAWYPADPSELRSLLHRAREHFDKFLSLHPESSRGHFYLGSCFSYLGPLASTTGEARPLFQTACDHYAAADALRPDGIGTLATWGRALIKLSECVEDQAERHALWDLVREKFKRGIALGDAQLALTLARFEASRDSEAAIAALRIWRDHSPHATLGSIGDYDVAFDPIRQHPGFIAIQDSFKA